MSNSCIVDFPKIDPVLFKVIYKLEPRVNLWFRSDNTILILLYKSNKTIFTNAHKLLLSIIYLEGDSNIFTLCRISFSDYPIVLLYPQWLSQVCHIVHVMPRQLWKCDI